ncbi:unnamed protein product [Rhodiola kirilowii]
MALFNDFFLIGLGFGSLLAPVVVFLVERWPEDENRPKLAEIKKKKKSK